MTARIVFVSNLLPLPPRNGITIPLARYVTQLAARAHRVEFVYLDQRKEGGGAEASPDGGDLDASRNAVTAFHSVPVTVPPRAMRALGEMLGRRPAFDRWRLPAHIPTAAAEVVRKADVIWATPRGTLGTAWRLRKAAAGQAALVAGVNDVWSALVRERPRLEAHGLRRKRIGSGTESWRLFSRQRAEARGLRLADSVLVQTPRDLDALAALGLSERGLLLPNGVAESLFCLPLEPRGLTVGFIGTVAGGFGHRLSWFLDDVWPGVTGELSEARLLVSGIGLPLGAEPSVTRRGGLLQPFRPRIEDVYAPLDILAAPVFKGHGLLNKVIEAMAAGTLVVGDSSAFNGISGFEAGIHGLVARDADSFARIIVDSLRDPKTTLPIRVAARQLVERAFSWADRLDKVEALIAELAAR